MVIDDDVDFVEYVRAVLESAGHEVLTAMDGPSGLAMARLERPDVILVDLLMVPEDGFTTCDRLRQEPQTRRLAILVASAIGQKMHKTLASPEVGARLDADGFLEKPVEPEALARRVGEMVELARSRAHTSEERRVEADANKVEPNAGPHVRGAQMSDSAGAAGAYFIPEAELRSFLAAVRRGPLFATVAEGDDRSHFERIAQDKLASIGLRCLPPVESAKSFLFPVKERVAVYPGGQSEPETGLSDDAPQILLGVRACDLLAVEILDRVLREGEFEDPFYAQRRDHTLLVSVDCVAPAPTCFCNLVGGKPYPDGAFDLNLTPIRDGYVVSIGSQASRELVLERAHSFREATREQAREREQVRNGCISKLEEQNARFKPSRPLEEALAEEGVASLWLKLAAACVECGGCSHVCPTCHCFLLYDQIAQGRPGLNERIKAWDSCLLGSFAKMAGVGGVKTTPRPELPLRFENRVRHKFEWFKANLGRIGCVGCGRCTEACLGGRDIREVIKQIGG
jgi:CheY-like chemotaxis protein